MKKLSRHWSDDIKLTKAQQKIVDRLENSGEEITKIDTKYDGIRVYTVVRSSIGNSYNGYYITPRGKKETL